MRAESGLEKRGPKNPENKGTETSTYRLESGATVELTCAHSAPREGIEQEPGRGVVIVSGWGNDRLASMKELPQAFADQAGGDAYVLIPRTEERGQKARAEGPDLFHEEARAIAQFIKEKGLREVTVTGHSMGADRAMNVVAILQEDPEMHVDGLVLMGPVGLYERTSLDLAKKFITHTGVGTPSEVKNLSKEGAPFIRDLARDDISQAKAASQILIQGKKDGALTQISEIMRSWGVGPAFLRRIKSDIKDMARKNPYAEKVTCPIVLIAGASDTVSDREKIMPIEEERKIRKALGEQEGERKDLAAREQFLKENLFKNSPYIRMIVPEKMGNHLVQIFRPEAVAKVSMYFLERYNREHRTETPRTIT